MARCAKYDPLEKFRFLVEFSDTGDSCSEASPIKSGFHDVQMPKRTTTKIAYREGLDPDISGQSAGLSTMEDIVFNRGLLSPKATDDNNVDSINGLYKWMSAVHDPSATDDNFVRKAGGSGPSGAMNYRKDVTIKMLDRSGETVRAWKVYNAFPVNFVPGSDLNAAEDGEKAMESLTLAYEDFQEIKITDSANPTNGEVTGAGNSDSL